MRNCPVKSRVVTVDGAAIVIRFKLQLKLCGGQDERTGIHIMGSMQVRTELERKQIGIRRHYHDHKWWSIA
jgi:hypothetical protein